MPFWDEIPSILVLAPSESVASYTSTPNIVAAANISIVVPQTEFCFSCFKWFSNVVGGSIVETRGLNISGLT